MNIFENVDTTISKQQGNLGVARAVYEYTKMGYTVLAPLSDSDKYDLVVDTGTVLLKVQVKTSRCPAKSGQYNKTGWTVNLATKGGNTSKNTVRRRQDGDYDLLFILTADDCCWSIPVGALGDTRTSINVGALGYGAKYNEYKITMAE